eukprot:gene10983-22947_t
MTLSYSFQLSNDAQTLLNQKVDDGSNDKIDRASDTDISQSNSTGYLPSNINSEDSKLVDSEETQEQLELILRTFKKLPAPEISRMGVDIEQPIQDGTKAAEALRKAWRQRQIELKEATEAMVKPVEFMANLTATLQNIIDEDTATSALIDLESFLTDVDNAGDFHTIGGWPILTKLLEASNSDNLRMRAAWIMGTAVKNNYDYQLWFLESTNTTNTSNGSSNSTCVELLVAMLNSTHEDCKRKALYAISSAARGNTDIQQVLLQTPFLQYIHYILSYDPNFVSYEIRRKIWAFISDMLEESYYIRHDLIQELKLLNSTSTAIEQVLQLELLGDNFCSKSWANLAKSSLITHSDSIRNKRISNLYNEKQSVINAYMNNIMKCIMSISQQSPDVIDVVEVEYLVKNVWQMENEMDINEVEVE